MLLSPDIKRLELWNWHQTRHVPVAALCAENHHLGSTRILIPVKIIILKINGALWQTTSSHQDGTLRMRLAQIRVAGTCVVNCHGNYTQRLIRTSWERLFVTASGFAKFSCHLKSCWVKVVINFMSHIFPLTSAHVSAPFLYISINIFIILHV